MLVLLSLSRAWHILKKPRTTQSCGGKHKGEQATADIETQRARSRSSLDNYSRRCCPLSNSQKNAVFMSQSEAPAESCVVFSLPAQTSSPSQPSIFLFIRPTFCSTISTQVKHSPRTINSKACGLIGQLVIRVVRGMWGFWENVRKGSKNFRLLTA